MPSNYHKMAFNIEAFIWYLFLIDSVGANIMSFLYPNWLKKHYKGFWKHFPVTKGWTLLYLVLVLWVGWTLLRMGVLWW